MKISSSYLLSILMSLMTLQYALSTTVLPANFLCKSQYITPNSANRYYISTQGSDTNAGTSQSAAWKTFKKAQSVVKPGSTVTVAAGVYYEQVFLTASGTANAPIVYISENGQASSLLNTPNAILDGINNPAPSSSDRTKGCPNQECFQVWFDAGVNYVHFVGFEIRNVIAPTTAYVAQAITVHDPSTGVVIANNWIHYIRAATQNMGNAHAIDIEGTGPVPITNIKVLHNEVGPYMLNGWSECVTMNGYVDGGEISDNWIHDNTNIGIVLAGGYKHNSNTNLDYVRNVNVLRNLVYNCSYIGSDGLYCDGCRDSLYQNNIVYANANGIETASENGVITASGVTMDHNIVYGNDGGGTTGGFKKAAGSSVKNTFTNNLFMHNKNEFNFGYHITNLVFTGNTIIPTSGGNDPTMNFQDSTFWSSSNTIDDTTYYMSPMAISYPTFGSTSNSASREFASIAALQANAPGYDAHGKAYTANVPRDLCSVTGVTCVNSVPQPLMGCPNSPPQTQAPTTNLATATASTRTPITAAPSSTTSTPVTSATGAVTPVTTTGCTKAVNLLNNAAMKATGSSIAGWTSGGSGYAVATGLQGQPSAQLYIPAGSTDTKSISQLITFTTPTSSTISYGAYVSSYLISGVADNNYALTLTVTYVDGTNTVSSLKAPVPSSTWVWLGGSVSPKVQVTSVLLSFVLKGHSGNSYITQPVLALAPQCAINGGPVGVTGSIVLADDGDNMTLGLSQSVWLGIYAACAAVVFIILAAVGVNCWRKRKQEASLETAVAAQLTQV